MAMGASQVSGAPSACAVVPGPGLLNAGGGLTSAYWAGGRVFTISGAVPAALDGGEAMVGTVDAWLLWRLSGERVHVTDVSNASRTMLMDVRRRRCHCEKL